MNELVLRRYVVFAAAKKRGETIPVFARLARHFGVFQEGLENVFLGVRRLIFGALQCICRREIRACENAHFAHPAHQSVRGA
ncbi:MAG TPA: hypothetical protein VLJ21_04785 [Candidatus Binatia bacterium]|nr:hypothetical protein [Candidatus Binatia bacterium]